MPNDKKRRFHHAAATSKKSKQQEQVVVAGLQPAPTALSLQEDSIESCLAEMSAPIMAATSQRTDPAVPKVPKATDSLAAGPSSSNPPNLELWNPTLTTTPHPLSMTNRDRNLTWNRAMRLWQKTGKYTPALLPSFDVELTRHFKVQALSSFLLESCKEIKMPAFERWLIDSKLEEQKRNNGTSSDPVLSMVRLEYDSSQRLLEEIRETGMKRPDAKKLVQDLCRRTGTADREIAQQQELHAGRVPLKKGDRIDLEGRAPVLTLVYHRPKHFAKPFCIKLNSSHYDKLRDMFNRVHNNTASSEQPLRWTEAGKPTKLTHAFHELLMVLLLRYSSISGGQLLLDLRGGGMQGAIHGQVFQVLAGFFPNGPLLECFGSPLNAYLPSFGSAFRDDLDWHFGSIGSFLTETVEEGCCEANPPFSPGMMTAMAERIDHNLTQADERKRELTFVVIVPNAGDSSDTQRAAAKRFGGISLKLMTSSSKCRLHILLSAKEHGYVEGAQHMRPTRFKASLYDTSVIVLQSKRARKQPLDKALLESRIRQAFASRHEAEVEQRKLEEKGSDGDASSDSDSSKDS